LILITKELSKYLIWNMDSINARHGRKPLASWFFQSGVSPIRSISRWQATVMVNPSAKLLPSEGIISLPPMGKRPESLEVFWAPAEPGEEALREAFEMLFPEGLEDFWNGNVESEQPQLTMPS
jgi:hypothetical protein